MKKLFHPGIYAIIASIAITVASCSKSANDIVITEQSVKKELPSMKMGKQAISPSIMVEEGSKFYSMINQPYEFKLGVPGSYLPQGSIAVFYVILSAEFAKDPPSSATLNLMDDETGDVIDKYELISKEAAGEYNITVPVELAGYPFLVGIVELNEPYNNRTIALHSEITVSGNTTVAHFGTAFSVMPQ